MCMYPVSPRVVTPSHLVDRVMSMFNGLAMVHWPRVPFPLYLPYHSSPLRHVLYERLISLAFCSYCIAVDLRHPIYTSDCLASI